MKKFKNLERIRKSEGYSQKKLAQKLGISKQYMWGIEIGEKTLSYKMAYKLSKVLKSTPDDIFLDDFKKKWNLSLLFIVVYVFDYIFKFTV